ncbi:aspartate carbamoyltransferase [Candidatus Micrarchaeota archaeon CG10_big_fil_rev_8_21_14_0_10_45_29]|nr:MAG: aspartate carbamoyltransferase [Candidatus Micrarchaeota archaeon CG10_big_fil_rev_8_21_14_0_10_45_29]
MHGLISLNTLEKKDIGHYLSLAQEMEKNLCSKFNIHEGKIASTLFFEPSTRTNLSFQAAAQRLGMGTLDYSHTTSSSKKGESLQDTIKIVANYSDIIIMRHSKEGAAKMASEICNIPVINAGDGANEHPTQALIDLYTIKKELKKLEGLNVCLVGDLKYGRTIHSLLRPLVLFGANITLVSPPQLHLEKKMLDSLKKELGAQISYADSIDTSNSDVIYMTRIQEERFPSKEEASALRGSYQLNAQMLENAKKEMIILHPLPRLDEIPAEIDSSPHAKYFEQAKNGVPVRMAILHDCLTK